MIRGVAFDFDGTLVLSNKVKRDGFFAVAADLPGGRELIEDLLLDPPDNRFAIFSAFEERYAVDGRTLASRYSAWCEEQIPRCAERVGASVLLCLLRSSNASAYVSSATPLAPFRAIIEQCYPPDIFHGVFGGCLAKTRNLRSILIDAGLRPREMLVVGDVVDDYRAALGFGCDFEGVVGGPLAEAALPIPLLPDLAMLQLYFSEKN